jgi:hypothetical protein
VPQNDAGWRQAPYEAQYLKLVDVTEEPTAGGTAAGRQTPPPPPQKHAALMRSFDNARTGANTNERILTPTAVKTRGLAKAFSLVMAGDDPRVEAQPLYVPDVRWRTAPSMT